MGYPVNELLIYKYLPDTDEWSMIYEQAVAPALDDQSLFVLRDQLYLGGSLWKRFDLKTPTDNEYINAMPDTTLSHKHPAIAGFAINDTGYVYTQIVSSGNIFPNL